MRCERHDLHAPGEARRYVEGARQAVFARGAADAPLMVIGEVVKLRDELQWFQKD